MRLLKAAMFFTIALLLATDGAEAQSTTGTLHGHVADAQGLAVRGVQISVTSPNLQGERWTVSSESGDYVLPLLPPGTYTVVFTLSGFAREERSLSLTAMQNSALNVQLDVDTVSEQVTVTSPNSPFQTGTPQVTVTINQQWLSSLANIRDLNSSLLLAPNIHATGPGGGVSIAGSPSYESLIMVNGVVMSDTLRGTPLNLYIEDAVQETVISSGGVSAEFGRFTGGIANVLTKSGGNTFGGSLRDTYNNDSWRALTPFEKTVLASNPNAADPRLDRSVPTYEYTFGGPVQRDRLWFFTAGRLQKQESTRTLNTTNIPYAFTNKTRRYEGKLTYAVRASHRVQGNILKIQEDDDNNVFGGASTPHMDLRSLGTRKSPQELYSLSYNGVLNQRWSLDLRYSARYLSLIGNGAKTTDRIDGTLMIDRSRGNTRYWSDTLCGVCTPEERNNQNVYAKASYFLSSPRIGTHALVFGYDNYADIRLANNYQSGSGFRILGTGAYYDGQGGITPRILGADSAQPDSTFVQQSTLDLLSTGSDFRTHSVFVNDSWRVSNRLTASLGLRWDKNHGADQARTVVTDAAAFSPRLGLVWDATGTNTWLVTAGFAKYVAAIYNTIADAGSAAGNTVNAVYYYRGPSINATAPTVPTDVVIRQVLDWFDAQPPAGRVLQQTPNVPGLTPRIGDNLSSPYTYEYTAGVSRPLGARGSVRFDGMYRNYLNFYASVIDGTTGQVTDQYGRKFDLALIENTDLVKRRYTALTSQADYRTSATTQIGGQYTVSRTWGNAEAETQNAGGIPTAITQYPEYKQESWSFPEGDLPVDQRHRARLWVSYGIPRVEGLAVTLVETLESGVPYGAVGGVDARPFVTNAPTYANRPDGANTPYFYTARDAFHTEGQKRSDIAVNYVHAIRGLRSMSRLQLFAQAQVINLFNQSQLCGCGGSVFQNGGGVTPTTINTVVQTAVTNAASFQTFNPFTTQPVQGVHWNYGPQFGQAVNRFAYTSPRQFRVTFGVRF